MGYNGDGILTGIHFSKMGSTDGKYRKNFFGGQEVARLNCYVLLRKDDFSLDFPANP